MDKDKLRNKLFNFLSSCGGDNGHKIKTKLGNISAKTGQYDVPDELYQKRTPRKNRVLISWKTVYKNRLSIEQLNTFSGGVAVEFVNEDFFEEEYQTNPTFIELKNRLGSNETVSSIITIRSESGTSSSFVQRKAFEQLVNNTEVNYNGEIITITKENFKNYGIKQIKSGGIGNEKWTGFLFVLIRGGQQDVIKSHDNEQTIFNPACEFANSDVSLDLDLVMSYFAMISVDSSILDDSKKEQYEELLKNLKETLSNTKYNFDGFSGTLLDYCDNHPSVKMVPGKLYDPIQVEEINIEDFAIDNKEDPRNLDFTHNEAVNKDRYYWDTIHNCILTPARPTNAFWSRHLSNMMQQNFSLEEYFKHEEDIIKRRNEMLKKDD